MPIEQVQKSVRLGFLRGVIREKANKRLRLCDNATNPSIFRLDLRAQPLHLGSFQVSSITRREDD